MTLDEAIEILTDLKTHILYFSPGKTRQAVELGIEALKRLQSRERIKGLKPVEPLPGETEEVK